MTRRKHDATLSPNDSFVPVILPTQQKPERVAESPFGRLVCLVTNLTCSSLRPSHMLSCSQNFAVNIGPSDARV